MIGLNDYAPIVGQEVIDQLQRLAERLGPRRFVHINSTRTGGGVAEILRPGRPPTATVRDGCQMGSDPRRSGVL